MGGQGEADEGGGPGRARGGWGGLAWRKPAKTIATPVSVQKAQPVATTAVSQQCWLDHTYCPSEVTSEPYHGMTILLWGTATNMEMVLTSPFARNCSVRPLRRKPSPHARRPYAYLSGRRARAHARVGKPLEPRGARRRQVVEERAGGVSGKARACGRLTRRCELW